jgi:DNA repair exonuclease SbcCD ATPase subunit
MEWNEETKNSLASCNCAHREDVLSALAHIETLEKLVTQAAEQIRDVTARQSVSDASFDLASKAVISLRERVDVLEAEKAAAVLALGESQSNGERWRQSMYALEERVLELTKERDAAAQPKGKRYYAKVYQDPDGKMYSGVFKNSLAELTQSRATAFAGIAEVILLEEPVSEKADLVQRINKYLFCAKEQGGSAVLLKEAKELMEKGEPKNG